MLRSDPDGELIQSAARVFAQQGYHGTSVTDLCAELEMSRASLYYRIDSKEQLLAEIHEAFIEPLLGRLERAVADSGSPREALERFSRELMRSIADEQSLVTVFFDQFAPSPRTNSRVEAKRDRLTSLLISIFDAGVASGDFKIENSKMAALAFLGMHNWAVRWFNPSGGLSPEEISAIFMKIFLGGCATSVA